MGSCSKFFGLSVLLFLLLQFSFPWVGAVSGDVVPLEVADAEEALVSAYGAVLDAEEAGANVSGLLGRLSVGGEYLAEAYAYLSLENSESAGRLAGFCVEVADNVEAESVVLREEAERIERADVLMRVFVSAVGVVIVVVGGFVLWKLFKRRYHERILNSMPEVVSSEV